MVGEVDTLALPTCPVPALVEDKQAATWLQQPLEVLVRQVTVLGCRNARYLYVMSWTDGPSLAAEQSRGRATKNGARGLMTGYRRPPPLTAPRYAYVQVYCFSDANTPIKTNGVKVEMGLIVQK